MSRVHADDTPVVGIVTVTYNSEAVIEAFLRSCATQSMSHHLVIVDNASTDSTLARVRDFGDESIEVLPQAENLGIAVGNNLGITAALEAGCEYVLLLNNDTEFAGDLVESLVASARSSTATAVVPSIRYFEEPDKVWFEAASFSRWRGSIPVANAPATAAGWVECACTCCALVHRSVFEEIGLMDERYFVYFDDTDFFFRIHAAGLSLRLDPEIVCLHKVSSLTGGEDSDFSMSQRITNRTLYLRTHGRGVRLVVGLAATAANAVQLAVRSAASPRIARLLASAMRSGWRLGGIGPGPEVLR